MLAVLLFSACLLWLNNVYGIELNGLSLHGDVVTYYQAASAGRLGDDRRSHSSGAGYTTDFEFLVDSLPSGEFFFRLHAGEGMGADDKLSDFLYANLNTLADDNPDDVRVFSLLEAYYVFKICEEKFLLYLGKMEPPFFIDDNEFANDERYQFVGKPFVNNPIVDSEFQFAPSAAVVFSFTDEFEISAIAQSNAETDVRWSGSEWESKSKSVYADVFDSPFYAFQLSYHSTGDLPGNYRIYYWYDCAEHVKVGEDTGIFGRKPAVGDGWGVGISFDQKVSNKYGIFGRFAWSNDVYEVRRFYSAGMSFNGLIPSRHKDAFAFGLAALVPDDTLDGVTEWHFETYYRVQVSENFYISPDFQYVVNPGCSGNSDDIIAGMLRLELNF